MSRAKHTPGPWLLRNATVTSKHGTLVHTPASVLIDDTDKANALLIAAAPEMYEFILRCETWFARYNDQGHREECRRILNKARGES